MSYSGCDPAETDPDARDRGRPVFRRQQLWWAAVVAALVVLVVATLVIAGT
jgi:hypothetical protein